MAPLYLVLAILLSSPLYANDHGGGHEAPPADAHGGGHGEAPPAEGHGEGGGEHGGGHGEQKAPPKQYPAYSQTGIDDCKIPKAHKRRSTPQCGSEEYREYVTAIDTYNGCIETFDTRVFLPLRPCRAKPKKATGPDYRKLLDPP
jgi:hypothetical protein